METVFHSGCDMTSTFAVIPFNELDALSLMAPSLEPSGLSGAVQKIVDLLSIIGCSGPEVDGFDERARTSIRNLCGRIIWKVVFSHVKDQVRDVSMTMFSNAIKELGGPEAIDPAILRGWKHLDQRGLDSTLLKVPRPELLPYVCSALSRFGAWNGQEENRSHEEYILRHAIFPGFVGNIPALANALQRLERKSPEVLRAISLVASGLAKN